MGSADHQFHLAEIRSQNYGVREEHEGAARGSEKPEEELEQITQKYYRGRENAAGKEGSGLGLYISRILMEKMQGELSCSCPDGGYAVTLSLPLS